MRKLVMSFALAAAVVSAGSLLPSRADAAPITLGGIQAALDGMSLSQDVRYVCRRVCSPYRCWRRCYWTRGYRGGYRHRYYRRY